MRFSKWHALGNSYLLVERGIPACRSTPRPHAGSATSATGSAPTASSRSSRSQGAQAEIVIWNPDGSVAEFSGNGSRIAAAWLGRRAGAAQVTIAVVRALVPRGHSRRRDDRDGRRRRGGGGDRDRRAGGRAGRADRGVRRQPARGRAWQPGARGAPSARPAAGGERALPRPHECPARRGRREQRADGARVGARSGGDERVGVERRRGRGCCGHERLVREPGDGPHAGWGAARRAGRPEPDHARRPGRGDLRRRRQASRQRARTLGARRSG